MMCDPEEELVVAMILNGVTGKEHAMELRRRVLFEAIYKDLGLVN